MDGDVSAEKVHIKKDGKASLIVLEVINTGAALHINLKKK